MITTITTANISREITKKTLIILRLPLKVNIDYTNPNFNKS